MVNIWNLNSNAKANSGFISSNYFKVGVEGFELKHKRRYKEDF